MAGTPLARLNETVPELLGGLHQIGEHMEFPIEVHLLGYRTTPRWLYGTSAENGLPPLDVPFADLSAASQADLSAALQELSRSLLSPDIRNSAKTHVLVVLLTNGQEPMTPEVQRQLHEVTDLLRAPKSRFHSGPMRMLTMLNCSDTPLPQELLDACSVEVVPNADNFSWGEQEQAVPVALPAREISRLLACVSDRCFTLYYS